MKKTIISLLAASLLAPIASAQLWVENTTDTNLTFAFRSVADGFVNNQYDSNAGARATIDLSNRSITGFTLTFGILNLSGGSDVSVGNPPVNVGTFGPGTITGFGFNVVPVFSAVILGVPAGWVLENPGGFGGGGIPSPYDFEVGSTTNGVTNGIDGGGFLSFAFDFTTAADATSLTLPNILGANVFGNDFVFRFQETTGAAGSDKVGIWMDGGGGGSGVVPEPSTYGLFGALALLGLMVVRQVRRR